MRRPANDNRRDGPTLGAWLLVVITATIGLVGVFFALT